jgi:enediyne biosynthesis protein E4
MLLRNFTSFALCMCLTHVAFAQKAPQPENSAVPRAPGRIVFREIPPTESGITWSHNNAHSPERYLPETVGGGCAFLDYDNDGWMDILFVNSGPSDFFHPEKPLRNALYHNNHDGTFTDVTDKSGLAISQSFGMGVAVGDYDGDGWPDIYITAYGKNTLYHNNKDGTFTDVTEKAGVAVHGWSTNAVWFDYDNDGKLDLFVSSFVEYNKNLSCGDNKFGRKYYCIPRVFAPRPSRLFHNNGDGTFTDVSQRSGIARSPGKSFGVVVTDVNNDGWMDLFVANDTLANFLFVNQHDGTFKEVGLEAGVAYSDSGTPRSGMGVDAADYDNSGWQSLFVANIDRELFSLYHNEKDMTFSDQSGEIGPATRPLSGWGLKFFDYDNDGDADLILANGHPDDMVEMHNTQTTYKEPLMMFENVNGAFRNVSAESGPVFAKRYPARGLAIGDFDNDGYLDVLVCNNGEPPLLLHNEGDHRNNWIGLQLVATKSNPAAIGAVITWVVGGVKKSRLKNGGGSYLASHDPREILGIGAANKIDSVEVRWPSGTVDRMTNPPINQYTRVVEGEGLVPLSLSTSATHP